MIKMPSDSRIMRQVVALMAADRILARFLDEAVGAHIISRQEAKIISDGTLQVLLPSAAEEASEEKGIVRRPRPEYVLQTIHRLKTALLFHLPLFGPERMEKNIDADICSLARQGFGKFGLGCQLLDDVRDLARDHLEKRHNYLLSLMSHEYPLAWKRLEKRTKKLSVEEVIFEDFADEAGSVVRQAHGLLLDGLKDLNACGLGLKERECSSVARWMFKALDVDQARKWLK
jgi:geranylgeranyl pyrophosphate synthase